MLTASSFPMDPGTGHLDPSGRARDVLPRAFPEPLAERSVRDGRLPDSPEYDDFRLSPEYDEARLKCENFLHDGDWQRHFGSPDVVYESITPGELAAMKGMARYIIRRRSRHLLRLMGQFMLALKYGTARLAYAQLIRQWDNETYRRFAALCAEISAPPDAVPIPLHAWPRPPTAPLAPPLC